MTDGMTSFQFWRGLCTREADEGGRSPDRFAVFQNARTNAGGVYRRAGCAQIAQTSSDNTSVNVNGSSQYFIVPLDTRIHQFGLYFTWEALVSVDSYPVAGAEYIWGCQTTAAPGLLVGVTNASKIAATVYDSAGNATTLTSSSTFTTATAYCIQVVRSAASLTLRVNNVSEATGTMSATNLVRATTTDITIGRHDGGYYFDGQIDYVRAFRTAKSDHADGRLRLANPWAEDVLFDYVGELDAATYMRDRGRYEAHAKGTGTPTETTALALQDAQVTGARQFLNRDGAQRVLVIAGGRAHLIKPGGV